MVGLGAIALLTPSAAMAQTSDADPAEPTIPSPAPEPYLRPPSTCPEMVEPLMTGLLRDLPSYANRVAAGN
ncbi:MAG: hypothetical protein HC812_01905 [Leptolyngbya sp. RL_3_1]|nr:hypothetical protein [Leptolyngbya sp. RL_3_1]